jgi:hemerythrin superfamily protein
MNPSNVLTRLSPSLSPSITSMIRMDHSHVLVTFHKYQPDLSPGRKRAIVQTCSRALEIHAQLEEEIFYPALGEVDGGEVLDKSRPEHDELRRLIGKLRDMEPTDANYDGVFYQLIRDVMHHVADEETVLLPEAERLLKDRLSELGAQMTRRRMELVAPHAGEIAVNTARVMPAGAMLLAGDEHQAGEQAARRAGHRSHGRWQHDDRRHHPVDRRRRIREERTEQPELIGI